MDGDGQSAEVMVDMLLCDDQGPWDASAGPPGKT